jgi:hypothetical protein
MGAQIKRAAASSESLVGLAALFGGFLASLLVPAKNGAGSRQREFSRVDVFWAFLGQVLTRGASCRWALSRLQADAVAKGRRSPEDSTSGYCQARASLSLGWLQALFDALGRWFEPRTNGEWCGRAVRLIDGTGFSMPDTEKNRQRWPYGPKQKAGCGFPTGKLVGLFCLHSGRLLAFVEGGWHRHDLLFARRLLRWLHAAEVVVADRAYCGWQFLALLGGKKVDFVIRLNHRTVRPGRHRSWQEIWKRPDRRPEQTRSDWKKQPQELVVRFVRFQVHVRGFRTKTVIVVTSLLDKKAYPDFAIAELYARRWQVELHFRQIKTNLSLDVLRCLTPEMIERELWMHAIAYNLVRALILEAALTHGLPIERFSFKGALDALQAWADHALRSRRHRRLARRTLLARLASDQVPPRPGRSEPRARKRRPKVFPNLNRPRRHFIHTLRWRKVRGGYRLVSARF